ncbi:hypothetical protein [Actinomadura darangshiensis]|uniref:hypothetical protein n=1 Tax=Actinomadura darangshiensis TaxID=705336 RepID=UPI001FB7BAEE|nr:hypothetical protein [Actinomadura darangshiensis]
MNDFSTADDALAEIERTQQRAYAGQRLPLWYLPGVVGLGTVAGIAAEVDGTAQIVLTVLGVVGLAALTALLASRTRIKFRQRTWTVRAGAWMAAWFVSALVLWGVVPLLIGLFTDSDVWQKAIAGVVTAAYTAATTRPAENRMFAHLGVVR